MSEEITSLATMNEAIQGGVIGVCFSAVFGTIVFFIQRFIAQKDAKDEQVETKVDEVARSRHADLVQLTKDMGKLEAARDRSLETDIRIMNKLEQIEKELRSLSDKVLILEATRNR